MPEISNFQNLNAYYSTETKIPRPENVVVNAPNNLPTAHLFNDKDANKRLESINKDIYVSYKEEEKRETKNFIKFFAGFVIGILTLLGIKKLFK